MEGDYSDFPDHYSLFPFQSTPSAWRETAEETAAQASKLFQSTPSAWRETAYDHIELYEEGISIHSLRMEGDFSGICWHCRQTSFQSTPSAWRETILLRPDAPAPGISIHSLRMEGDACTISPYVRMADFNPLPPHGGRPWIIPAFPSGIKNFNPLPPHGGRPHRPTQGTALNRFQSTPSAWRET